MGRQIPKHELAFLAPIPDMALGAKGNVEEAFCRLHEPSAHRKPDALKRRVALTTKALFRSCGKPSPVVSRLSV